MRTALATEAMMGSEVRWWPFTPWQSTPSSTAKRPAVSRPKRLADSKAALLASAVFQRKTAVLCSTATGDMQNALRGPCERVVSERLFCAMFLRHRSRFDGMEGAKEQQEECNSIDIMENSSEAAKDEQKRQQEEFLH